MNNFITTLFHFINNPDIHDSNYLIAYGLIRYGNQIQDISIHELSEKCLVSVSAINRFINLFGFKRYQIFKSTFYNHIKVRESQMLYRYSKKEESQLKVVLSSFLKDDKNEILNCSEIIQKCCHCIKNCNRIVLVGSDEMIPFIYFLHNKLSFLRM